MVIPMLKALILSLRMPVPTPLLKISPPLKKKSPITLIKTLKSLLKNVDLSNMMPVWKVIKIFHIYNLMNLRINQFMSDNGRMDKELDKENNIG